MQSRVLIAFILTLAAFILSVLVLTAGTKPGFLEEANYETILNDANIQSDVPSNYDWISYHILAICYGNFDDNNAKINIHCSNTSTHEKIVIPWAIGVALSGLLILLLPLFFFGRFHWNGWMCFFLTIDWIALMVGATAASVVALDSFAYSHGHLLVPMVWTCTVCIFIALIVEYFEFGLQRFTPKGEAVAAKYKPDNVAWVSYNPRRAAHAVHNLDHMAANSVGNAMSWS